MVQAGRYPPGRFGRVGTSPIITIRIAGTECYRTEVGEQRIYTIVQNRTDHNKATDRHAAMPSHSSRTYATDDDDYLIYEQ